MNRRGFLHTGLLYTAGVVASSNIIGRRVFGAPRGESLSLKEIATKTGFNIGAQVEKKPLQIEAFARLIINNFNLITPGNELKWKRLRPDADSFHFDDADWMLNFAEKNHLRVHGHNLCWNANNPDWLEKTLTKENAHKILTEHIARVVGRYKGKMHSWDVVNEPVVYWSKRQDGLYPGPWVNTLGESYLDTAFTATAAADPDALRVLNIYNVEHESANDEKTRTLTLDLLKRLVKRKVPIQAIGIESHLNASKPIGRQNYLSFLHDVRALGLQILFTEIDVDDSQITGDIHARDEIVAQRYGDYLAHVTATSETKNFIFWTVCDKWDWLDSAKDPRFKRTDGGLHRPGLFDQNFATKSAYLAVSEALKKPL